MTDSGKMRWGILGPGGIAQAFAAGLADSTTGTLVAIGTRNPDRPNYAEKFPGARIHTGYQALLDDKDVDAIYIATPHPFHAQWGIKAARAGKHVLIEKPMGLSAFEADAMFNEARKAGTFMGEAFMYRVHPQTAKLIELVAAGVIGQVRMIKSSFGFAMPSFDPEHRLYANDLAGGGILDVGCYPVSMARLIAGAAQGKDFAEPVKVSAAGYLGQSGVDEWTSAILSFANGIIADVSCSVSLAQDNVLRILGTEGRIEVKDFWFAGWKNDGVGTIEVHRADGNHEIFDVEEPRHLYTFEADAVADAVEAGRTEFAAPGMSWDDTLGNLRVLDQWRAEVGLKYEIEKPHRRVTMLSGEPLSRRYDTIRHRTIPGIEKPASQVALGFESFPDFAAASILLDHFYERGGTVFDTAHIYQGGQTERNFGDWLKARDVRENVILIGKGAHSPLVYPDVIAKQLDESLERLGTDYVDLYFMHRDNLDIPVGEFVDAMDTEVKAGRIRGPIGGSNWSRERLDEARAYAKANGKTVPTVFSNNFSLAEMLDPIWPGVMSSSSDEWKAWQAERDMVNFAWSSQARGFFTDLAGPDKRDNAELVRCWYSDRNFARRERAVELASKLGKSPIHVALAFCFYQPFDVVPLIGPRRVVELDDSLEAFDIELTPEDVRWLDTGER